MSECLTDVCVLIESAVVVFFTDLVIVHKLVQ